MKTGVCIIGRNDGYGGHLEERAIYCINSALKAFDEVVYVDWNSPGDITLLEKIKPFIKEFDRVQQFRVKEEYVSKLTEQKGIQKCCEVLARNIGIRRLVEKQVDYIVSSNIDIIFPTKKQIDEFVVNYMTNKVFCTIARRDLNIRFSSQTWQDNAKIILEKYNEIYDKINSNFLDYETKNFDPYHGYACQITCCGDFQIAHREVWSKIKGFEEEFQKRGYADTNVQLKAYHAGFIVFPYFHLPIFHINHSLGGASGNNDDTEARMRACFERKITLNSDEWGFPNSKYVN